MCATRVFTVVSLSTLCVLAGCAGTTESASQEFWDEIPVARSGGLRDPFVQITLGYAPGSYHHETSGTNLDDTTSAGLVRFAVEGVSPIGVGGGLALEFGGTDDDLFENVGAVDGQVATSDVFLHFTFRVAAPQFRMPIRVGPYLHTLRLEDNSPDELTWASFGARVQIEPEVLLVRTPNGELGLFAELGVGAHGTAIELDSPSGDEDYDSDGISAGANIGVRGRWTGFTISLSYIWRHFAVDDSDIENFTFVREIDTRQDGLLLEMGFSF